MRAINAAVPSGKLLDDEARGVALGRLLDLAEDSSPVQAVEAVARGLRHVLGATAVSFLIVDISGRALVRLAHVSVEDELLAEATRKESERRDEEESAAVLPFDGGPAEQALRSQTVQVLEPGAFHAGEFPSGQWTVLAPVTERGEVLGLLEMSLPAQPGSAVLADIARTAHALAFVVIANRRHTDLFEWGQRSIPFSLSAEIQRRLLPAAYTCEAGAFTLSAWLEAAEHVGGDTFDYSLGRDALHLSVTDAMGHGVASALVATLCVGSLRNTRRKGATLLEQAAHANTALIEHVDDLGGEGFATGVLGHLDLRTASLELVNAGHVAPYLFRAGVVQPLELHTDLPLGMFANADYRSTTLNLEQGDRLVFLTDGMLERNAAALDMVAEIGKSRALHPREATRRLADSVLATAGPSLDDDATLLILDWHGNHGRDRHTTAGSDSAPPS